MASTFSNGRSLTRQPHFSTVRFIIGRRYFASVRADGLRQTLFFVRNPNPKPDHTNPTNSTPADGK